MTADPTSPVPPVAASTQHSASRPAGGDFSPALAQVSCVRVLMLGWCLWLLGSWAVAVMLDGPKLGGCWLVMAVMVGLMLAWPAMRLSQPRLAGRSAVGEAVGEWLCLVLVLQAVIWPLRLTTGWTVEQSAWLDIAIAAWSALTAVLIAWGRMSDSGGVRALAMGLCVAVVLGEPAVVTMMGRAWQGGVDWAVGLSPVPVLWSLSSLHPPVAVEPWRASIVSVAVAASAGMVVVGVWEWGQRMGKG